MALLFMPWSAAWAKPLLLDEVLRSSAQHAPAILEALSRERAASGRQLAASGAFDLVFEADGQTNPLGTYDGTLVDGRIVRPLTQNGGNLYGGYRISRGAFATYDGKGYTNQLGELRAGAVFSLLRDRLTDDRRTALGLAAGDVELARLEREMVAIGVQRRAIDAYQQWVVAGSRVAIYRDLLALATARQASIERQIALGARPEILGTENRQNIVRRTTLLVRSEQDLAATANALSFYLRDDLGQPRVPTPDRLPDRLPELAMPDLGANPGSGISRPDLEAIVVRLDQVEARRRLAENQLAPRLDLRVELSKDLGAEGRAGPSRTPAEGFVGFRFSVPLERRLAKGRIDEAEAEAGALAARRQLIQDQIAVEVKGLAIQVEAALKLTALAAQETRLAESMADAERRRFTLGASDFIVVNLREETAADARLRQVDAEYRQSAARAELIAATVDLPQLGL